MEALQWANDGLKRDHRDEIAGARVDSPMLDAELLLAEALGVSKNWLFTHFADAVPAEAETAFKSLIERRMKHEPVAYLRGRQDFFNRPFAVNPNVLIPRPETETMVEKALWLVPAAEREHAVYADIGTGSGAIAVTLAAETTVPVIASDISKEALEVAKQNAKTHGVEELVDFREGDLLDPLLDVFRALKKKGQRPFRRLVVCANLPYLTEKQWEEAMGEVRDHEPKLALTAGVDGLDAYWKLFRTLRRARTLLPTYTSVLVEIDPSQAERIVAVIRHDFPHQNVEIVPDLGGLPRVAVAEI